VTPAVPDILVALLDGRMTVNRLATGADVRIFLGEFCRGSGESIFHGCAPFSSRSALRTVNYQSVLHKQPCGMTLNFTPTS
jgi:hypothetical protein